MGGQPLRAKWQISHATKRCCIAAIVFFVFLQQHLFWKNSFEHNGVYTATCDGGAGLDLDGGVRGKGPQVPGVNGSQFFAKAAANAWSLHCRDWECTNVRRVIGGAFRVHLSIQMTFWRRVKTQNAKTVAYPSCSWLGQSSVPLHLLLFHVLQTW